MRCFMFKKLTNPNAKKSNIALAVFYMLALAALLASAVRFAQTQDTDAPRVCEKTNS